MQRVSSAIQNTAATLIGYILTYLALVYFFPETFGFNGQVSGYLLEVGEGRVWLAHELKFIIGLGVGCFLGYIHGWNRD